MQPAADLLVDDATRARARDALRVLGVRNFVLGIHDASFPGDAREDTGRGTPYSDAGARFFAFARALGFDGVQLGPSGELSEGNPSPYDSTAFARSTLSVALGRLAAPGTPWSGLLAPEVLARLTAARPAGPPDRARHGYAFAAQREALDHAFAAFERLRDTPQGRDLAARFAAFVRANAGWLARDGLYDPLCREHGAGHFRLWRDAHGGEHPDARLWAPAPGEDAACAARRAALAAQYARELERHAFAQMIAHEQHADLRARTRALGLKLFGDLQVGYSERDVWSYRALFLADYRMGAPPSRTNPEGQPWGYPVLDPAQYGAHAGPGPDARGPALELVWQRMSKMLAEYDGVRLDHPHGLVCPWVYRAHEPDALRAVQTGARLFDSPDLPDHPALARFAIALPEQLDRAQPRYADGWVRALEDAQVERYSALFDVIVGAARANGRAATDLLCEVLSTQPYPLGRVMARYGLGRFRVTQKADLARREDVYRGENAAPADWIMLGTHDTPPIYRVAAGWQSAGTLGAHAAYLAERLAPDDDRARAELAARLAADPRALVQAKFADLFVGPAQNVYVFFADLFGVTEVYNAPGTTSEANWSLRLPPDYAASYGARRAAGDALDVPRALAAAIRARGREFAQAHRELVSALERG